VAATKKKKGGRRVWAGGVRSWAGWAGLFAGKRRKGLRPEMVAGQRSRRKGGREREGFCPFFLNFFQIHFSNIQNSNQTKNPCIQIMMHKHLLSLNYFSDVLFI
jgi:hypothetical protein